MEVISARRDSNSPLGALLYLDARISSDCRSQAGHGYSLAGRALRRMGSLAWRERNKHRDVGHQPLVGNSGE